MKNLSQEDKSILAGIRAGSKEEDAALRILYSHNWPTIRAYVFQNKGNEMDASDVFQEGVIAFHKNVIQGKFDGESAISTYLYAICRFIWLKKLGATNFKTTDIENIELSNYEDPEYRFMNAEKRQLISELFLKLGEPCQTILTLSYYENETMSEIASKTGYKNEQNVRNKKHKCMKALKELIMNQPEILAALRK